MILHRQGTQPRLIDSSEHSSINLNLRKRNSVLKSTTVCLEIKQSFVLDSARTWLKIWNRVDRGPFTNQGQKGNEIG